MNPRRSDFPVRLTLILPLLLFSTQHSISQIAGGLNETTRSELGGRSYITGNVVLPSSTQASFRVRIRISAPGKELIAYTDNQGKFVISGLKYGMYTISVDADGEFDSETHQVDVMTQTVFLNIRLRAKKKADTKAVVISADMAGVPNRAVDRYKKGLALSAEGNTRSAIEELRLAVAEYPEFMLAHSQLGVFYQKVNELEKADEHLQLALKIKPDAFDPLVNRGIVLVRMKRFEDAEQSLRNAVKAREDFPVSHYYLGRALFGLKRLDEAEASFKTAYALGGKNVIEARRALASLYLEKGDHQRAVDELQAYLMEFPSPPDAQKLRETIEQLKEQLQNNTKPNE